MSAGKIFVISCLLIISYELVEGSSIRRYNYDARLYEHFSEDSRYIQYSRTEPSEWMDIPKLMESKNLTFSSMTCTMGPGAWIFYPGTNYEMKSSQRYFLVIGEHCVRTDDIDSIQPLGKMDEILDQGVLLFDKPDFASASTVVMEGEGSGGGGSLIFVGPTAFLVSGGSKKICLKPGPTAFEYGYCLLPDVKASLGLEGSVSVKEGCSEEPSSDEIDLSVENCYGFGAHEIYNDEDLSIDKLTEVCSGGGDDFAKSKFTILLDMWTKRMGMEVANTPEDNMYQVKVDILWKVLIIFTKSCPIVDSIYVYLIGHFYINHIREFWKADTIDKGTTLDGGHNETDGWRFTAEFFDFCLKNDEEMRLPVTESVCRTGNNYGRLVTDGADLDSSWFEIANGHIFDTVIEQMWLIINTVIPSCNKVAGYVTNDWSELVYIFHKNFLDPLQEQWAEPGDWARIYNAVLVGYNPREVHRDIVACLETSLRNTPQYDPIGRPKSFNDRLLYKFAIPENAVITKKDDAKPKPNP